MQDDETLMEDTAIRLTVV